MRRPSDTAMAFNAEYRQLQLDLRKPGNYFPVPRKWTKHGLLTYAMLAYLLNCACSNANKNGWLLATPAFIEAGTGANAKTQDKLLARLEQRGLIEVSHNNGNRFIRIDVAACRAI